MENTSTGKPNSDEMRSQFYLNRLLTDKDCEANRLPAENVRSVLVVMSATAMVFDRSALEFHITRAYPNSNVFFMTTSGKFFFPRTPKLPANNYDLLIDFTGPRQRQSIFLARKFRKLARVAVGRNAGMFRKRIYDRVFDDWKAGVMQIQNRSDRERVAQKEVLKLAGVGFKPVGSLTPDLSKVIASDVSISGAE